MPENWKTYKLSEALEIKYGKDHKKVEAGNIPIYGTGGIMRYGNQFLYDKETILIPRKGSLNNIYYLNEPFWSVDTIFWSKINEEVAFPKYLFYNLKILDFASMDVGSAIPSLTTELLKKIEIRLPELPEQIAIASILSALDDKIELNLQMNKTLEEMAMALYKHWFVDFGPFQNGKFIDSDLGMIPEGWEVKRLEDISKIKGGKRLPKGAQLQITPNSHPYIRVRDFNHSYLSDKGMEYVPNEVFSLISNYIVSTNDVVLTIVGTVGSLAIVGENLNRGSLTENCVKITLTYHGFSPELIYLQLKSVNGQDEIRSKTVGSTQPKLPIYNINSLKIVLPHNLSLLQEIISEIKNYYNIVYKNTMENQTLTTLRDTLLPKLISGEVRVKDVENLVQEIL
ncbi:restriction endonuclease subunit S [Flavobacterium sandaracinum]|uniref:Restriction endonuclease subunit S n=1 Tax=Flavobacterium sandaracinum TaxID=2541733 RepID=A0A4R5D6D8_9FLAO|nr:restriction endonuclease subunit S [Flavobacterium sandaracinum]TDE07201.1 restriction endonuclease subunit S [Flavobacterium sandaracinum]